MLDIFGRVVFVWLLVGLIFDGSSAAADFPPLANSEKSTSSPMNPDEVVKTAKLPPGFRLSVVAAEPAVQNPIAMTTDERGRLWIAENFSWAGSGAGGFNADQRDRIVILEDADGDGRFEKRTVFSDTVHKLTSIEVGNGGVWALCLPNLLFFPDADRNDVPDDEPRVVLDGFQAGSNVGHTPANGLKWGPDGWLYGRHGILATSEIGKPGAKPADRFRINTGVWRYHPKRDVAEAVMHGMTNSWGYDFDQHGEMFVINTVIGHLWHVVAGAHTERMFGTDINPFSYVLIPQVADHVHWDLGEVWNDIRHGVTDRTSQAGGGHAHIGLMIYQGDNWPEEYRNRVYTLNLHGMRINSDHLLRKDAGYTATHGPDLCFLSDPWFRGMELLTGPDGGVFIADWSDTGECHDHDGVHRTSGRIYKLTYGTPQPLAPFDLAGKSNDELIGLLSHRNTWWARQARRLLTERATTAGELRGPDSPLATSLRAHRDRSTDVTSRLRMLETIVTTGGASRDWLIEQLSSGDEHERVAALRSLIDSETGPARTVSPQTLAVLQRLANADDSGLVRLHVASSLQRLPIDQRWDIAESLVEDPRFATDRMLPLMIWYGIEPAVAHTPAKAIGLIARSRMPIVSECIARRLAGDSESSSAGCGSLVELLIDGKCPTAENALHGLALAFKGRKNAASPEGWQRVASMYGSSAQAVVRDDVQSLNVLFGDHRTLDELRQLVTNGRLPAAERNQALRSLLLNPPADYAATLIPLLRDQAMVVEALRGLAHYSAAEIPQQILEASKSFEPAARAEMIQTLACRPAFARELLQAVRDGRIASSEITAIHARQIASFDVESLNRDLTEVWGDIRTPPAEKKARIEAYKSRLTPAAVEKADRSHGRVLFQKTCANCHVLFGAGRLVGPDLTGSNRRNLDYLIDNMVDPSATVGANFRSVVVVLESGRVLNGVISEQNDQTITLLSAQELTTIDRKEIEEMKTSNVSLMPDGLLQNLTETEVRDLVGYLMGGEQAPLPGNP
ncbi:Cytochrome c [Caulifigura coniformis]|uniref:Cytochrome c n=1 Tax=Caulifigura coniformis TaxID=2527983 RepID=A0A517SM84_9PLAN|nr:PVC-type heme-binding CxxCH protein [Caulifigura coniformis]QDT57228.1 Cytochrome c [Caulifigura coniformis]